jgi:hypothetical protein
MTDRVPAALLRAVAADHRPVHPLPPPWRRALTLLPLGVLAVVMAPVLWGWRGNLEELGLGLVLGLSGLQALTGMLVIAAALREAVPGRGLSRRALLFTALAAIVVEVGTTLVAARDLPAPVASATVWLRWAYECFGMEAVVGAPVLAAVGWLAARALPERPALAGGLCGLGAGLVADAGARLFCWISEPAHVFLSHGAALLALTGAGALCAVLVDRAKARRVEMLLRAAPGPAPSRGA